MSEMQFGERAGDNREGRKMNWEKYEKIIDCPHFQEKLKIHDCYFCFRKAGGFEDG
jgi:hypothetical protein